MPRKRKLHRLRTASKTRRSSSGPSPRQLKRPAPTMPRRRPGPLPRCAFGRFRRRRAEAVGRLTLSAPDPDQAAATDSPLVHDPLRLSRTMGQQFNKRLQRMALSFGDDFDSAVGQVRGAADETQFQGPDARPPAEPHSLDLTAHPRGHAQCHHRALRGRGWHRGQVHEERFMNASRWICVPQRGQACPARP